MKRNKRGGVATALVVAKRRHCTELAKAKHAVLQGVYPRGKDANGDTNTSTAPNSTGDARPMPSVMPRGMPFANSSRMPMPIAEAIAA